MDLASELTTFIKKLRDTSEVCMRPRENGHKCPQCYERLSIAKDLEWMLRQYFDDRSAWAMQGMPKTTAASSR